ncbi:MAG TPA: hypothetical protein P5121_21500 [Caldilineaceae bacterium]|nr:hypothetical protein [Caldilineaceae bacterium]
MHALRILLIVGGLVLLIPAWGFTTEAPWATQWFLWPEGRLSYLFIASMQAAIAAAMLWIGITQAWHMIVAGAVNLFVMMSGLALFLLGNAIQAAPGFPMSPRIWIYGTFCAIFALFNFWLIFWARQFPETDRRPMPVGLRVAFTIFVVALIAVGVAMVAQVEGIFPWPLKPASSVVFGWMFLGDAFYFLFALLQPRWGNAATQLWSFLAYDALLIGPFLQRLRVLNTAATEQYWTWRYSLLIYISILLFSAAVAIYYLFLSPATRIGSQSIKYNPL